MDEERYIRQIILDDFGFKGQQQLNKANVIIIGCGGLGSIVAPYLAGAGIGKLKLVDGDTPQVSNLHRQVFFTTGDYQTPKSLLLKRHIEKFNPDIETEAIECHVSKNNISDLLSGGDVVVECSDDIQCKYLVNDFCHLHHIPVVYGSIHKYEGYLSFFRNKSRHDIHLRDLFPVIREDIPSCSEVGVINTVAGVIGLLQANEVIKYLLNSGKTLDGELLIYDVKDNEQTKLKLKKNWNEDIKKVFQSNRYISFHCDPSYEINITSLLQNKNHYKIVSVLEPDEHTVIFEDVIHQPLSSFDHSKWIDCKDPVVFYCSAGKRSGKLVTELRRKNPDGKFYSLKNGLRDIEKAMPWTQSID